MIQRRILLVDNSPVFLRAIELILTPHAEVQLIGFANSGREALDRVGELQPDLVLLDLVMPAMDGLEVMRRLAGQPRRPRIIITTAHDDEEYRRAALRSGADGFLCKSELKDELLSLIRSLLPD